jgi:transcriptional regulator with XRE-family HTH domain
VTRTLDGELAAYAVLLGKKLRAVREARGLSQVALGRRMGVERNNLQKWENGKLNVTIETLLKLATALDSDLVIEFALRTPVDSALRSLRSPNFFFGSIHETPGNKPLQKIDMTPKALRSSFRRWNPHQDQAGRCLRKI